MNHLHTQQRVSFRPGQLHDLKRLTEIESTCFHTDQLSSKRLRHFLTSPSSALWVALNQQMMVLGYGLLLLPKRRSSARIYSLAVHPDASGQGIGQKLLDHLEKEALGADRVRIRLEASEHNTVALSLYRKNGYAVIATVPNYYENGETAIRLEKKIAP